jgi:hypothetical protein
MPYGPLERDLCNLARVRVKEAIESVLQIADTKETQFLITLQAMSQAVIMSAATYSAVYVGSKDDPFEVAKIVLDIAKETHQR